MTKLAPWLRCSLAALTLSLPLALPSRAHAEPPLAAEAPLAWKPATQSPHAVASPTPREAPLVALCGAADAALAEVAGRSAHRQLDGSALIGADELAYTLRASGDPHVWPRAWSISGQALDDD